MAIRTILAQRTVRVRISNHNPLVNQLLDVDPTAEVWDLTCGRVEVRCAPEHRIAVYLFCTRIIPAGVSWEITCHKSWADEPTMSPCVVCKLANASCGDKCKYCAGRL